MPGLFCVGIAALDYIYGVDAMPRTPEKYRAHALSVVGGGLAANAAVAAARLGGRVRLATRLGGDLAGAEIVRGLAAEGIDTELCRQHAGRTSPVSAILVDAAGERLVVSHSDPEMPASADWLPTSLPEGTGAVLGDTRWHQGTLAAFALARAAGLPAVLDADRRPADPAVLTAASHVAFSQQALREISGLDDPREGLLALAARQDNWLAVTLGGDGVLFVAGGAVRHVPGFAVAVVDTLGAGDIWHGAFALALAEGMDEAAGVRFASAAAALKCTRFGGRAGAPDRAELDAFLQARPAE